jgi:hypothetical protein
LNTNAIALIATEVNIAKNGKSSKQNWDCGVVFEKLKPKKKWTGKMQLKLVVLYIVSADKATTSQMRKKLLVISLSRISLLVLLGASLDATSAATTERRGQGKVSVALVLLADHEGWYIHQLLSDSAFCNKRVCVYFAKKCGDLAWKLKLKIKWGKIT